MSVPHDKRWHMVVCALISYAKTDLHMLSDAAGDTLSVHNQSSPYRHPEDQIRTKTSRKETAMMLAALSKIYTAMQTGFEQPFGVNLQRN